MLLWAAIKRAVPSAKKLAILRNWNYSVFTIMQFPNFLMHPFISLSDCTRYGMISFFIRGKSFDLLLNPKMSKSLMSSSRCSNNLSNLLVAAVWKIVSMSKMIIGDITAQNIVLFHNDSTIIHIGISTHFPTIPPSFSCLFHNKSYLKIFQ